MISFRIFSEGGLIAHLSNRLAFGGGFQVWGEGGLHSPFSRFSIVSKLKFGGEYHTQKSSFQSKATVDEAQTDGHRKISKPQQETNSLSFLHRFFSLRRGDLTW